MLPIDYEVLVFFVSIKYKFVSIPQDKLNPPTLDTSKPPLLETAKTKRYPKANKSQSQQQSGQ